MSVNLLFFFVIEYCSLLVLQEDNIMSLCKVNADDREQTWLYTSTTEQHISNSFACISRFSAVDAELLIPLHSAETNSFSCCNSCISAGFPRITEIPGKGLDSFQFLRTQRWIL